MTRYNDVKNGTMLDSEPKEDTKESKEKTKK